jgi:hypothetical protein
VSENGEKLNESTDELSENTLSLNKSCSRNENVTKLKDEMCNTNGNAIKENDQICQVTDLSDTTKESKWNGITKVKVGCDAKESDTMKSNTCKTCNNCMTNGEEKCCREKTRLKDEQENRKANHSFQETNDKNDKTFNLCAATVEKERYTDKSVIFKPFTALTFSKFVTMFEKYSDKINGNLNKIFEEQFQKK